MSLLVRPRVKMNFEKNLVTSYHILSLPHNGPVICIFLSPFQEKTPVILSNEFAEISNGRTSL